MNWMPIEIRQTDSARTAPSASIGYGRIELSKSACDLIGKIERYPYAELFMDADSDRAGIRLLRQQTSSSVPVRPKKSEGKRTGGACISSKAHMLELFGSVGTQRSITHYAVTIESQQDPWLVLTPRH